MNQLTSTNTPGVMPMQHHPRPARVASGPVVLVRSGHEGSAPGAWADALAAALKTELVALDLPRPREGVDPAERLAEALCALSPRLVVLPAAAGGPGDSAGRLAVACGVPCLVARSRRTRRGVLAATSLGDRRHPVLQEAASVAGALGSPLTFLYNTRTRVVGADRGASAARLERRIDRLATSLGADVVLTRAFDPVAAILGEARREDAELIVVGSSDSAPSSGPVGGRVAGLALRSVLVVPLASPP